MIFLIADTFTSSLARLTGDEQKAVKTTVFDLQVNPESPGLSYHKLDRAKNKHFWSVRVSGDIRVIVHRGEASLLACYVDHHDKAYSWAERRRLEVHPKTGAAQLVEIRESFEEIRFSRPRATEGSFADKAASVPLRPFARFGDDELLGYGVPLDWLHEIRLATEDSLLSLMEHLPAEAAEALLELATGGKPRHGEMALAVAEQTIGYGAIAPFLHPDARRRFRVMNGLAELEAALAYPWEKWAVFLHPDQRELVERGQSGPFRVSGSAGTGKTVVALHRAVHLARKHPDARILLTTFSEPLARFLALRLRALVGGEPRLGERIDIHALSAVALRLAAGPSGKPRLATGEELRSCIEEAAVASGEQHFGIQFLLAEWNEVVDAWQIGTMEEYRTVPRLGRKARLSEGQRDRVWPVFERTHALLTSAGLTTEAGMFTALARRLADSPDPVFDFIVVDEAQDLGVAQLRFLSALGKHRPDALFFAGDLGQRIFQQPFSWKSLGIDVTGRSRTLRVNYRTSHQIRSQADRLLDPAIIDADGNAERRDHTVSTFNGPPPVLKVLADVDAELEFVAAWIRELRSQGVREHEFGIFVRSTAQFERARRATAMAGLAAIILDDDLKFTQGNASIATMHLAKGLEFRAVIVMACDDSVIPLEARLEAVGDNADLEDVYNTERQLFYVALTRARDWLLVTAVSPGSEFLDDML